MMIRRERIGYFDTQKFGSRIKCKNEEWANFGVKIKPKKVEKMIGDVK